MAPAVGQRSNVVRHGDEESAAEPLTGAKNLLEGASSETRSSCSLTSVSKCAVVAVAVTLIVALATSRRAVPLHATGLISAADVVQMQAAEGDPTLYCYAFIMPFGVEPKLVTKMYERQIGPFGCDASSILSNTSFQIGTITTDVVPGSFSCEHGGKWGTALNTENFIRVWQAVNSLGLWRNYDWSIKIDADAVFFPERFRDLVTGRTQFLAQVPPGPVYLNNCQWGMHGPVEAISREAMDLYYQRADTYCEDVKNRAMDINVPEGTEEAEHAFGEDEYIRECLEQVGVTKIDALQSLLSERYACAERPQDCGGARVTFHAFKNVPEFMVCLNYAEITGESSWPVMHEASDAARTASQNGWLMPEDQEDQAGTEAQPAAPGGQDGGDVAPNYQSDNQ